LKDIKVYKTRPSGLYAWALKKIGSETRGSALWLLHTAWDVGKEQKVAGMQTAFVARPGKAL